MAGGQAFGPFPNASLGTLAVSWIESKSAGTETGILVWHAGITSGGLTCGTNISIKTYCYSTLLQLDIFSEKCIHITHVSLLLSFLADFKLLKVQKPLWIWGKWWTIHHSYPTRSWWFLWSHNASCQHHSYSVITWCRSNCRHVDRQSSPYFLWSYCDSSLFHGFDPCHSWYPSWLPF